MNTVTRFRHSCAMLALVVSWTALAGDMQGVFVLKEIDDDHAIIVTESGEKLLLDKWSLRFSPLGFEGKTFMAEVGPMWVIMYFENKEPMKWAIDKSLGFVKEAPRQGQKKRKAHAAYIGVGSGHWVQEVMGSGKMIKLEDGSLWEVSPIDTIVSALWLPVSNIAVVEGDGPYPYLLVNTDDGEKVEARYLSQ